MDAGIEDQQLTHYSIVLVYILGYGNETPMAMSS
jgi:hypothetical protein